MNILGNTWSMNTKNISNGSWSNLLINQLPRGVNASVNANGAFCLPENIAGAIFAM